MAELILVVNPGSTSTKLALFHGEQCLVSETLCHEVADLAAHPRVVDQLPARLASVRSWVGDRLDSIGFPDRPTHLDAIAARGGLLQPLPSGTYLVDEPMVRELLAGGRREHASNLAAPIALDLAREHGVDAYCVDPVSVDEMEEVARISGLPELERQSLSHALSLKAAGRRAAAQIGKAYQELNMVIAHLGGGISVSAHRRGRMVDVNNANDQGPFSPERVGTLPLAGLLGICSSTPAEELRRRFWGGGGLVAHLGTNDGREVERRIDQGDSRALLVYRAMAYQVAKEVGAMAAVLGTKPDAVVITGGLAHSSLFVGWVSERVSFLGPVLVYPGGDEMEALAMGVLRVLRGQEQPRRYGASRAGSKPSARRARSGSTPGPGPSEERRAAPRAIRRLDDLLPAARRLGPVAVAIAAAEERELLLAARDAAEEGIAVPYLVGDAERIRRLASREGIDLDGLGAVLVDVSGRDGDTLEIARRAVQLVHEGKARLLMKGRLETADLLRAVLDRDGGLRGGALLSHVALMEVPGLDRLLYVTDSGVVLHPTLQQKVAIVRNVVMVAHALGLQQPRVAVLAASESVNPEVATTIDAAALAKMADRGQISGALVDGPFGLDNAVSPAAAAVKGVGGPVAGRADVLVVPGVEAGNLMAKMSTFLGSGRMAGIVVGGLAPVVLTSRADPHQTKLLSIALGAIVAAADGRPSQPAAGGDVDKLGLPGPAGTVPAGQVRSTADRAGGAE